MMLKRFHQLNLCRSFRGFATSSSGPVITLLIALQLGLPTVDHRMPELPPLPNRRRPSQNRRPIVGALVTTAVWGAMIRNLRKRRTE